MGSPLRRGTPYRITLTREEGITTNIQPLIRTILRPVHLRLHIGIIPMSALAILMAEILPRQEHPPITAAYGRTIRMGEEVVSQLPVTPRHPCHTLEQIHMDIYHNSHLLQRDSLITLVA
jgi:hypothetical protein